MGGPEPKDVGRGPERTMKPRNLRKTVPPECGQMRSWSGKAGRARDEAQDGARRIPMQNDIGIQNGEAAAKLLFFPLV